jgi:integrase
MRAPRDRFAQIVNGQTRIAMPGHTRESITEFFTKRLPPSSDTPTPSDENSFCWLIEKVKSSREADWKPNTKRINVVYLSVLQKKFGHVPIRDMASVEAQDFMRAWLQSLAAEGKSSSYIRHLLTYLRAGLNEAVKRKLIHYNFASELKTPARVKETDQRFISLDQTASLISFLRSHGQRRDGLIVQMLYLAALRPGELFALRWNDWAEERPDLLRIDEAFGKSGMDVPKTPGSKANVYLPPGIQLELAAWKQWCGHVDPDAFMFESKARTPWSFDNYRKRILRPAGESVGIAGLTFQMLRRSFSTAAVDSGASVKDIQSQMRHTTAAMSLHYAKSIPRSVQEEVRKLEEELEAKTKAKSGESNDKLKSIR